MNKPALDIHDRIKEFRLRVVMLFIDALLLSYVWLIGNLSVSVLFFDAEHYNLVPMVWMIPFVVLGVALWQSFGRTAGMGIVRRFPMTLNESSPSFGQRVTHLLCWFAFPVGVVTALWDPYGRLPAERFSGILYTEPRSNMVIVPRPWYRRSLALLLVLVSILTLGAAVGITEASLISLVTGASKTAKFWKELVSPDSSLFLPGLSLLMETFFMAMLATMAAVLIAVPLSFFAARNLATGPIGRAVYTLIRVLVSAMRSVDVLVWAIIFALWVEMGSFAGALALLVHSVADLLKLYSEQLEGIEKGPIEAVSATGGNRLQVIRYGVIPQILNPYVSFTLYRWDINVRMATIVGMVGGGGIGWRLFSYIKAWDFSKASTLMIEVMVLVWIIDYVSSKLRERVEKGASKEMALQLRMVRAQSDAPRGPLFFWRG
jgi:phosphonate transport system permease protein